MLQYFILSLASLGASFLTLFTGFGLNTILMPFFALFFPLQIAIAATAVVHLANNLFKAILVGKYAEKNTLIKFGIPAALASAIGAYLLSFFSNLPPLYSYQLFSYPLDITFVGLVIGIIVIISSFFELIPKLSKLSFPKHYLVPGGFISGFFGGLSGFQGMLRSAFLIKAGLTKEQYIGTSVICSIIVDVVRLTVYGISSYSMQASKLSDLWGLIIAASLAAFIGAYFGSKFINKITDHLLQQVVAILLMVLGIGIVAGLIRSY